MIKIVPSTCVGTLFTTCFYTLFPNHIAPKMFQSSEVKSSKSWQYVLHSTSQMSSIVALQEEKTGELLGRTAWCHEATDPLTFTGPKWPCWSTEYSTFKIKPKKNINSLDYHSKFPTDSDAFLALFSQHEGHAGLQQLQCNPWQPCRVHPV